jgi:hypothetical protein
VAASSPKQEMDTDQNTLPGIDVINTGFGDLNFGLTPTNPMSFKRPKRRSPISSM